MALLNGSCPLSNLLHRYCGRCYYQASWVWADFVEKTSWQQMAVLAFIVSNGGWMQLKSRFQQSTPLWLLREGKICQYSCHGRTSFEDSLTLASVRPFWLSSFRRCGLSSSIQLVKQFKMLVLPINPASVGMYASVLGADYRGFWTFHRLLLYSRFVITRYRWLFLCKC